jgi:phage shock protein A
MGVLSRFTNYIKTVMSSFLDRAEDPGQALDYSYEKQLEQLQNLKRSVADVVTNKNRLKLQSAQLQQKVKQYDDSARTALGANREDLARQALERKQEFETQVTQLDQQIDQLQAQQEKFVTMQQRLETRVESFRSQKEMVKSTYSAAQAQVKIHEAASGISEEMTDVNLAVERAQNKVLQMQARANALDELSDSGALPEIGSGGGDSLDRQIAALGKGSAVDGQLAAMKAQMQLPAGQTTTQAQLPAPSEASSGASGHGDD